MKKLVIAIVLIGLVGLLYAQPGPLKVSLTNLTQFVNQTAWRVFYSDTNGDVTELALGADGTYLKSNGAAVAPTWVTPAGSGDILADGSIPFTGTETFDASAIFKNGATAAGYITIYEDSDDGTNFTKIQTVAQAGDITYSLPPDDGDAGEQLQSNGSGVLTWETAGSFNSTTVDATTWSDNANAANIWTFDVSGTDHTMTAGNGLMTFSHAVTVSGALTGTLTGNADTVTTNANLSGEVTSVGNAATIADSIAVTSWNLTTPTITTSLTTNTPTTLTVAELDRLDGLAGIIVTDATAVTDIEGTGLSIGAGTLNWAAASTDLSDTAAIQYVAALNTFTELDTQIADKTLVNTADGAAWLGNHDFGGADLEIPQTTPATPDADGEIEYDMADGKLVIQHSSDHAELAGSTDVALTGLIKSFSGTIFAPDGVNDVITVKAINSIEFPHGVVITAVYLGIASDTTYVLTVQNFDDFDTINGANPTIDAVTYTADTTGEIIDSTPTYATIAAGQIIMISIPVTDVDWIHFEIYYYEPAA
ncbi:MAG: hypothetical protein MUO31_13030 [Thermodesulfovibrionales bacterium]|nr:hypothetical protein [Thermodesulfovibrionales bacterium]